MVGVDTPTALTEQDVEAIRRCVREFQLLNEKHYGGAPGNGPIRGLCNRVLSIADKICTDDECHQTVVVIDVPNVTLGDYLIVKGSLMDAATAFIDWEKLHSGEADAIDAPGRILIQIARGLPS